VTYDVVVSVNNPDEILLPGMTAYVNMTTAERHNVLLVPNAAVRFKPRESSDKQGGRRARQEESRGTVYVLQGKQLKAVSVATGITDNRFTEIVSGSLKAGDEVVVEDVQAASGDERSSSRFRMRMF